MRVPPLYYTHFPGASMLPAMPLLSLLPPLHVFGLPYPDNPWPIGLHNLSDFVIGISYVTISATLAWPIRRARTGDTATRGERRRSWAM